MPWWELAVLNCPAGFSQGCQLGLMIQQSSGWEQVLCKCTPWLLSPLDYKIFCLGSKPSQWINTAIYITGVQFAACQAWCFTARWWAHSMFIRAQHRLWAQKTSLGVLEDCITKKRMIWDQTVKQGPWQKASWQKHPCFPMERISWLGPSQSCVDNQKIKCPNRESINLANRCD